MTVSISPPAKALAPSRRRVDWELILGPHREHPSVPPPSPREEFGSILSAFRELLRLDDVESITRRAVELARERIGLVRAAIFLLDAEDKVMLGTWGTDLKGQTTDERAVMYDLGPSDREIFGRTERLEASYTVIERCPIVEQTENATRVVGEGWVCCTPIRSARGNLGMLFNDAGLKDIPVDRTQQDQAALLSSFLGVLLDRRARPSAKTAATPTNPIVLGTLRLLAEDPSLGGKEMAAQLRISVSRLARVFKAEMGVSLVDYRNRLRLERFEVFRATKRTNILEAALASGFGSYAQFHRVFREERGMSPSEFYRERSAD